MGSVVVEDGAARRTQSRFFRHTPAAAALSGERVSRGSIHAQAPSDDEAASRESATEVRPLPSGPVTSLTAPRGSPPPSSPIDGVDADGQEMGRLPCQGGQRGRHALGEFSFNLLPECCTGKRSFAFYSPPHKRNADGCGRARGSY